MIFWFSGTGNSRYVAERLSSELHDMSLAIMATDVSSLKMEGESLGFIFPVYSWGVPPQVVEFIDRLPASFLTEADKRGIWMVCTCGDETGMCPEMLEKKLKDRGVSLRGVWSVIMPNDYVLLPGFDVDSKAVEREKLSEAPERIRTIAKSICDKEWQRDFTRGSWAKLKTSLIYPLFKRWGISYKKWRSEARCIGCGKCAQVCPMKNIEMKSKRPLWGNNCASCCACFHICPVNAVQYGKATIKKHQYMFPGKSENKT